jgi:hypothetical protein
VYPIPVEDDNLGAPNCPQCLAPLEPVVGAWWCEGCCLALRPERSVISGREDGQRPTRNAAHRRSGGDYTRMPAISEGTPIA